MGHIPPQYGHAACPTNLVTWTDDPVVADVTQGRAVHRNEIRTAIATESTRRGLSATPIPSTDQPVSSDVNKWRKIHIDELRAAITYMQAPSEMPPHSGGGWCPSDSSVPFTWTDPTVTSDQTLVRAIHINELRAAMNIETTTCVCQQEACNYCSDCGYAYQVSGCYVSGCACDDHKYNECGFSPYNYWVYSCATVNIPGTWVPQTAYWNCMCNFTPPGISWTAYGVPHSPGYYHPEWGCMCNPFTWTSVFAICFLNINLLMKVFALC